MIPSSTEIRHFIEIYHTRHISRAALRLGITQPTLTQSLKRLEEKLGVSLFHRTKQGVVATKSAVIFYSRATQLSDYWTQIEEDINLTNAAIHGSFKLGCHQSVAAYTLPTLLKNIEMHAPKIDLDIVHDLSRRITGGIVTYDIDIGYVVNPPRHPDLILRKIGRDRVSFWKKKGLENPPKVFIADGGSDYVEKLIGKSFRRTFDGWKIVQSTSLELIRTLTLQGVGIGVLPERVALADNSELVLYNQSLPSRPDEIFLAYRRELLSSKAGKELVQLALFEL